MMNQFLILEILMWMLFVLIIFLAVIKLYLTYWNKDIPKIKKHLKDRK